jgi:hypothetical protein
LSLRFGDERGALSDGDEPIGFILAVEDIG